MTNGIDAGQYGLYLLTNLFQMDMVTFLFFSTEHGVFTKHFINFQQVSYFCLNFNTLISNMGGEFLLLNSFNSTIQINVE